MNRFINWQSKQEKVDAPKRSSSTIREDTEENGEDEFPSLSHNRKESKTSEGVNHLQDRCSAAVSKAERVREMFRQKKIQWEDSDEDEKTISPARESTKEVVVEEEEHDTRSALEREDEEASQAMRHLIMSRPKVKSSRRRSSCLRRKTKIPIMKQTKTPPPVRIKKKVASTRSKTRQVPSQINRNASRGRTVFSPFSLHKEKEPVSDDEGKSTPSAISVPVETPVKEAAPAAGKVEEEGPHSDTLTTPIAEEQPSHKRSNSALVSMMDKLTQISKYFHRSPQEEKKALMSPEEEMIARHGKRSALHQIIKSKRASGVMRREKESESITIPEHHPFEDDEERPGLSMTGRQSVIGNISLAKRRITFVNGDEMSDPEESEPEEAEADEENEGEADEQKIVAADSDNEEEDLNEALSIEGKAHMLGMRCMAKRVVGSQNPLLFDEEEDDGDDEGEHDESLVEINSVAETSIVEENDVNDEADFAQEQHIDAIAHTLGQICMAKKRVEMTLQARSTPKKENKFSVVNESIEEKEESSDDDDDVDDVQKEMRRSVVRGLGELMKYTTATTKRDEVRQFGSMMSESAAEAASAESADSAPHHLPAPAQTIHHSRDTSSFYEASFEAEVEALAKAEEEKKKAAEGLRSRKAERTVAAHNHAEEYLNLGLSDIKEEIEDVTSISINGPKTPNNISALGALMNLVNGTSDLEEESEAGSPHFAEEEDPTYRPQSGGMSSDDELSRPPVKIVALSSILNQMCSDEEDSMEAPAVAQHDAFSEEVKTEDDSQQGQKVPARILALGAVMASQVSDVEDDAEQKEVEMVPVEVTVPAALVAAACLPFTGGATRSSYAVSDFRGLIRVQGLLPTTVAMAEALNEGTARCSVLSLLSQLRYTQFPLRGDH